jgi:Tfp pilus assembly protein PilO
MSDTTNTREWHLDRRLHITHIISSAVLVVSVTLYLGDIRKDVEILKAERATQQQRDAQQDKVAEMQQANTESRLQRIDDKLDRVIEYLRPAKRH